MIPRRFKPLPAVRRLRLRNLIVAAALAVTATWTLAGGRSMAHAVGDAELMAGPPVRVGLAFGASSLPSAAVSAIGGPLAITQAPGGTALARAFTATVLEVGPWTKRVAPSAPADEVAITPSEYVSNDRAGQPIAVSGMEVGDGFTLAQAAALAKRVSSGALAMPAVSDTGFSVALLTGEAGAAGQEALRKAAGQLAIAGPIRIWAAPLAMAVVPSTLPAFLIPGTAVWLAPGPGASALATDWNGRRYSGQIGAALADGAAKGSLTVVNRVPLETYVAGVVPAEMPASWPAAALEAQAVACRTYALSKMADVARGSLFDLTDTTADQVYVGQTVQTPATDRAVVSTSGMILTYAGRPIDAFYEADSGGHTEASRNVWGTPLPYLSGVVEPRGYVSRTWQAAFTPTSLAATVRSFMATSVGPIWRISVFALGVSGRAIGVRFYGPHGVLTLHDDRVRTALGLPSNLFRVKDNAAVTAASAARSSRLSELWGVWAQGAEAQAKPLPPTRSLAIVSAFAQRTVYSVPTKYILSGRGDGPGLGMTQDGALVLAQRGATAAQILQYYYQGVTISTVADEPSVG